MGRKKFVRKREILPDPKFNDVVVAIASRIITTLTLKNGATLNVTLGNGTDSVTGGTGTSNATITLGTGTDTVNLAGGSGGD